MLPFWICLDRGPGQNDPADLIVFKCLDRHRHGQISLSGSGRTDPENNHLFADCINILLLSKRLWFNRLSVDRMADRILVDRRKCFFFILIRKCDRIVNILFLNNISML